MVAMANKVHFVHWAVTVALVSALLACSSGPGRSPEAGATGSGSPTPTAGATDPAAPSASPTPPPTPAGLPDAADGSRLSACRDGRCEVVIGEEKTIQLDQRLGLYSLTVFRIEGDEVMLAAAMPGGGNFACEGDDRCEVSIQGGSGGVGTGHFTAHAGARLLLAELRVTVVAVAQNRAVLQLSNS